MGKKTLFLIIENLDDIFDGLGTIGQQRLRSFLQEYKCCTILATTPVLFTGVTSRDKAFYGWFTPFHLQPLTHEAIELLTNIAAQSGDKELASFLSLDAAVFGGKKYRGQEVESLVEMIRIWYRPEEIKAQFDLLSSLGNLAHARYYQLALEDSRPHPMLLACESDFQKSIELGDAKSALQVWRELAHVRNISPERSQPIADLIVAGKFDEARATIRSLLDIEQKSANLAQIETVEELYLQGVLLYESGKWEAALDIFDFCLQQNSQDYQVLLIHGNTLDELGRYEEAIASYDKAVESQPDKHEVWNNRGDL